MLSYTVRFLCPAFLGNAEQSGQWRTPPFKALLRQWWRVAYAAASGFDVNVDEMREAEGKLFGAAADRASNRSRLRIRLDHWNTGALRKWEPSGPVLHPEVDSGRNVGSDLYLGYGPLNYERGRGTSLKSNAAIRAGETASFSIAIAAKVSQQDVQQIMTAIALINLYGAIGGRSRNGWGSLALQPSDRTPPLQSPDTSIQRLWRDALKLDWPHAIGRDEERPLVWQMKEAFADWKPAIKRLAEIKIGLRTHFKFAGPNPPHPRHWLAYPVTNHPVKEWDSQHPPLRLPNSLRFKLRPDRGQSSKMRGVIFHVPCLPPSMFHPDRRTIVDVWQKVHSYLDQPSHNLSRILA